MAATKEDLQKWAENAEEKFNAEILELAEKGAFQKLEEQKTKLEAPVFVMPNGKGYNLNEKAIPLLAKLADVYEQIGKGKTTHLFVSRYSVNKIQEEYPNIKGVKEGSKYMDITIQVSRTNEAGEKEIVPSAMKIIPMGLVNGDTLDKMKFFLKDKENGFTNPIPYDNYAKRIAKLVDYKKITPEAIKLSGAKAVIAEVWKEGQEKYREICQKNEKYFDERLEAIKNATIPTKESTKLDKLLYVYKKNYDKAIEANQKNKENGIEVKDIPFPTKASYDAAKELLLLGENLKDVQGYINRYDPNGAHNFEGSYYSNIVIRGLENDYKFNQEYKQKYGKTFRDVIKDIKSAKYQQNQRTAQGASR